MSYNIPTRKKSIKEIKAHIVMLDAEIGYYLGLAQQKLNEIDELDRAIYDLEHEMENDYGEEGRDYA